MHNKSKFPAPKTAPPTTSPLALPPLPDPQGGATRQAIAALGGYAYQLLASTSAWLHLPDPSALYLEVAEDYALVAQHGLQAVQVKNSQEITEITGRVEDSRSAALPHQIVHAVLRVFAAQELC